MPNTVDTAMVLSAGMGNRMRPLTDVVPKPLVKLGGRALIDRVIDRLEAAGVKHVVVNAHYLADKLEAHLKTRKHPRITISNERDALLDTGGGVVRALPLLGTKPFIIHNSDSVWIEGIGSNLDRLLQAWDSERMDCLMLLAIGAMSLGYDGQGDFNMDADGIISRREPMRQSPFVFTGVSIAQPRLFEGAPQGKFSLNVVWDRAIAKGRVYGVRMEGLWMHVGTPEALDDAERQLALAHAR
jgi:N-acetyl-alpha-D-muramate 1-phosphate uridylyltransferase